MSKIGIIIYARLNWKRLPNKVLKKINQIPLIEIIYLRLKKKLKYKIIVNTSNNKSDDKIAKFCKNKKISYFRGSLNNVFKRTKECLIKHKFSSFVRICSDRPFVDPVEIKKIIKIFKKNKYDIVTNQLNKKCPKGLACEIAKTKIFLNLNDDLINKNDREHIFNFFYRNKKKYKIFDILNKTYKKGKNKNLSIDTKKDFSKINRLFKKYRNIHIETNKVLKDLEKN